MLRPGRKPYQKLTAKSGYVFVWVPYDDPLCPGSKRKNKRYGGKWCRFHRYVMSKHLGRLLTRKETVHHVNGRKSCNRLSNLELWTGNHGRGARRVDLVIEWLTETGWREVKKVLLRTKHARRLKRPRPRAPKLTTIAPVALKPR